jgi:Type I phosphodiesterase / nucleotide pyrophosphatase
MIGDGHPIGGRFAFRSGLSRGILWPAVVPREFAVPVSLGSVLAAVLVWLASYPAAPAVATVPVVDHVVLVSVDGLNPDAIRQLGPAGAPTFHRLMDAGASTLDARTVHEATKTLPNHTSMVTGRPVTETGGHEVTFNEDNGSTVHALAGTYVASAFDVVHDNGGSTALFSGKDKLDLLDRSWNETYGAADRTGADDGRDKIDVYLRADSGALTDALLSSLGTAPPDFAMVHLRGPDSVGHARGYMSAAYVDEVAATDGFIGRILDTVEGSAALAGSTVVVVTSDHGGLGHGHGDETQPVNYTIPFFVWGTGVDAGADLSALNPDRTAPGTSRPTYAADPQPIRNAEAGNLVTELLGLGAIPGSRINATQTLDVG